MTGNDQPSSTSQQFYDHQFIEDLRRQMLKFAIQQMGNEGLAEDAVQEALIGAFKNADSFKGKAAFKTWVFSILKNKIADSIRQRRHLVEPGRLVPGDEENENFEEFFDERGFWQPEERPMSWGNPEESVRNLHFWQVFEACLDHLPGQQGKVFMMREFIEMDSQEICDALGITLSNLNVMLYRARVRLRECIENKWFLQGDLS
jgi:RNA polymerase sigma-70 factor (ECF subfamily)